MDSLSRRFSALRDWVTPLRPVLRGTVSCALVFSLSACFGTTPEGDVLQAQSQPEIFSYQTSEFSITVGVTLPPIAPVDLPEGLLGIDIEPALPSGLTLDSSTGVISGIPTQVSSRQEYRLTIRTRSGSTVVRLGVAVVDVAPQFSGLSASAATFNLGVPISAITLTGLSGGSITECASLPALPAGLSFGSNCRIEGTPTVASFATSYFITASNSGGSDSADLELTVSDIAPSSSRASTAIELKRGIAISSDPLAITQAGGSVLDCDVSPALPTGISLTSNCTLTGTPTALAGATVYTFTARNPGGQSQVTANLKVEDLEPTLSFNGGVREFTKNTTVAAISPRTNGATIDSCTVTPDLPQGLAVNSRCELSGKPTSATLARDYMFTASNTAGAAQGSLRILVKDLPPVIDYAGRLNFSFYVGSDSVTLTPRSNSGGSITQCFSSPTLPTGLSISSGCVISGTPTVLQSETPYLVTAYNSGGSSVITLRLQVIETPPQITYSPASLSLNKGVPMTTLVPSNSGGPVRSCSVNPALPAGLILGTDCSIGGAATATSAATNYEITARNTAGNSAKKTVSIEVNVAPLVLSYANSIVSGVQAAALATQTPTVTGGNQGSITGCSASPPLPSGISLNPLSCEVSGTPTASQVQTVHTITATGEGGPAQTQLTLTILELPPSISYSPATVNLSPGEYFSRTVINTGGAITGCSSAPVPPAGFTVHPDCRVEGSSAVPISVGLLVTATNAGGQSSASFTLSVSEVAPDISYPSNSYIWIKNQAVTPVILSNGGGAISSCNITPPLPTGLTLNTGNCQISGTPSVVAVSSNYVVTASNSGGVDTFALAIEVQDSVPIFSYPQSPLTLIQGVSIPNPILPSSSGAPIVSCQLISGLPAGLSVDSQCRITGTPSATQVFGDAIVEGSSLNGSAQATLSIRVLDPPPSLSLGTHTYSWVVGAAIAPVTPTNSGGPIASCSVLSSLPAGISINAANCAVSGTPVALQNPTSYRIRASNAAGASNLDITVEIIDAAPQISFPGGVVRLTVGATGTTLTPQNAGGGVTLCSSDTPLPAGLSLGQDCRITGTPTAISSLASYTLTGSNSWGSDPALLQLEVVDPIPVLSFTPQSRTFEKGTAITAFLPNSVGGSISSCAISPALSPGLNLNTSTCEVSGTPSSVAPLQTYTVTATNTGGNGQTSLVLEVKDVSPAIDYPATPIVLQQGQGVGIAAPINTGGGIVNCTASPNLPVGVTLNPTTCAMTGTAMNVTSNATYTITAVNSGGSSTDQLQIEVTAAAPLIAFAPSTRVFPRNVALTSFFPLNSGGAITSCAIHPALPAGLSFNTSTCVIEGTPTVSSTLSSYVITATNSAGSANTTLQLEILDLPPMIAYSPSSRAFEKGLADSVAVNSSGGPIALCSVTPPLPAGLSIDNTCLISGTASTLQGPITYTVTASNGSLSASSNLVLSVRDAAPSITYAPSSRILTVDVAIAGGGISATNSGGAITQCLVAPPLPDGLTLSSNCTLTGTPVEIRGADQYEITASNSGGHSTVSLGLQVRDVAPLITYPVYAYSFTQDADITDIVATNTGGAITHCTSAPSLPAGLGLDEECLISGRPIDPMSATPFVITAYNSGGSSSKTLTFSVDVGPPDIIFSPSARVLGVTLSMAAILPINNGGAITGCSISGAVPPGLSVSSTCMVSGVPNTVGGPWTLFLTATNARGASEPAELTLTVSQIPPVVVYAQNTFIYTKGTPISAVSPALSGGALDVCNISPALPPGLNFNPATCVISGTPTAQSDQQTYLVSASNSVGSSIESVTIRVNDLLPAVTYSPSVLSYLVGNPISAPTVSNTGGAIIGCSVSPPLPTGMLMNNQCQLSGTPLSAIGQTPYTVTTVNSGGSSQTGFTLTVQQQAPQLQYFPTSYTFSLGGAINEVVPFNTGGTIQTCSVTPDLPAGLVLDSTTCVISGVPTVSSPVATYTVTASNGTGTSVRTLDIQVATGPPVLSFSPNTLALTANIAVSPVVPLNTGGAVTACNVNPSLPVGISFSADCRLSGTPLATQGPVLYTITGANSYGVSSAQLTLSVAQGPPALIFNVTEYVFTQNVPITSFGATNTGGTIATCTTTPPLPAGLTISNNCVISGTPTAITARTPYAVQAANGAGTDSETIYITVNAGAPSITIASANVVATLRTAISMIQPSNTGGAISSCGITPSLPSGLSMNQQCQVTGTPTVTSLQQTYTVTASNASGNSSAQFSLKVRNQPLLIYDSRINIDGLEASAAAPSQNIWKMTLDGIDKIPLTFVSNGTALVKENKQASVDASGKIFYASEVSQTGVPNSWANAQRSAMDLWTVGTDGNGLAFLTTGNNSTSFTLADPVPQPGAGTRVAFVSRSNLTDWTSATISRSLNVFVMNKTGGGLTALTLNNSTTATVGTYDSREVSWRPDGTELVYTSKANIAGTANGTAATSFNLWRVSVPPAAIVRTLIYNGNGKEITDPVYSPDGTKILFAAKLNIGAVTSNSWNIFVINRDGTGLTNLTSETVANKDSYRARWSPDGSEIVFLSKMNIGATTPLSYNVWKMSSTGANKVSLTTNTATLRDADRVDFSPDGNYIAFNSKQPVVTGGAASTSFNIWVMRSDGTQMTARTTIGATASKDSMFGRGTFWYIEP